MNLGQYDMVALMPCPLKVPFEKELSSYLMAEREKGNNLRCSIDANVNNHEALPNKEIFNLIRKAESEKNLPEILFTTGLNYIFYPEFRDKFIGKGVFSDILNESHVRFDDIGYKDLEGEYSMVTINPLVMVVNLEKLGDRPVPTTWKSLIDEGFEDEIIIRGNDHMYCETVLLHLCKAYGINCIETFKKNLKEGLHPAEMVKALYVHGRNAETIYVMPYFFAMKLQNKNHVKIVWPEEGAFANPVSMLVKKDAREEVKELARFIMGSDMGQMFEDAAFPSMNDEVSKHKDMKELYWIGWDTIKHPKIGNVIGKLNKYLLESGELNEIENIF